MAHSTSTTMRRFEFTEGTSNKFWEIDVHGKEVTVRFGRIDSNGQTQTKVFTDDTAARKHADKLVKQRTRKGYTAIH
jgi:predicted DNA-binding WGR domain protein